MSDTQDKANATFATIADTFGARDALAIFHALYANPFMLDEAYAAYQENAYDARVAKLKRERWQAYRPKRRGQS